MCLKKFDTKWCNARTYLQVLLKIEILCVQLFSVSHVELVKCFCLGLLC